MYKQKVTGHITSLANGHLADASFVCEILTTSNDEKNMKKREHFADTICFGDACRLWSNEGMFQAFVLVW